MENWGCVTWADAFLYRSRPTHGAARVRRHGAAARDGAHVVRRPGDHALVGRPVAQRGVRVLGRDLGGRVARPTTPTPTRPSSPPWSCAGYRADMGPAHPPDPRRGRRRGRRVRQLRRDHLREGAGGPPPAGGLRRRGTLRRGTARLLPRPRLGQHDPRRPDARDRRGGGPGPRRLAGGLARPGRHRHDRPAARPGRHDRRRASCSRPAPTAASRGVTTCGSAPTAVRRTATPAALGRAGRDHRRGDDGHHARPWTCPRRTSTCSTTATSPSPRSAPTRRRWRRCSTLARRPARRRLPGRCGHHGLGHAGQGRAVGRRLPGLRARACWRPSARPGSSSRSSPWLSRPPSAGARRCSCPGAWPGWPTSPPTGPAETDHRRPPSTRWPGPPTSPEHFELLDRESESNVDLAWRVLTRRASLGRYDEEAVQRPARPRSRPGRRGPLLRRAARRARRPRPRRRPGPGLRRARRAPRRGALRGGRRVLAARPAPPARALGGPLPRGGHVDARRGDAGHAQPGPDHGAGHRGRRLAGPGPRRRGGGGRRPPGRATRCSPPRTAWPG